MVEVKTQASLEKDLAMQRQIVKDLLKEKLQQEVKVKKLNQRL